METEMVPAALRGRLGPEATAGLVECLRVAGDEWKEDGVTLAVNRFEQRLAQELSALRTEMREGQTAIRVEMHQSLAALRVEMRDGQAALRVEMHDGQAALRVAMQEMGSGLRQEMAATRADVMRWSFVFWIGQALTTAGLVAALIKFSHT